jgi:Skp family chaperone for outer membrane proteins
LSTLKVAAAEAGLDVSSKGGFHYYLERLTRVFCRGIDMKVREALLAVVAGAAGIMMCAGVGLADDAAAPPLKLGVCDPVTVLNKIQEGKDVMAKWKADGETLQNEANVKKGQLQTEADEIKLLLPTSKEYEDKVEKFTEDQADSQAWLQAQQVNMMRKQREEEKALFDKILDAVSDVAKDQGLTIVINGGHADFPELDKLDANAFLQTILLHTSLYSDPALDITDKVVIEMDKKYSTGGTGDATPAPAPEPSH